MKSQKSLGRLREQKSQIFGFSYFQDRDLSLNTLSHAFKSRVIQNRGEFIFRKNRLDERLSPCVWFEYFSAIIVYIALGANLRSPSTEFPIQPSQGNCSSV